MQELELTRFEINKTNTEIKTIRTNKTICFIPTTGIKEANNFASMIEDGFCDCNYMEEILKPEQEKLFDEWKANGTYDMM